MAAPATSVVVLDRGNNTTCTVNLHGMSLPFSYLLEVFLRRLWKIIFFVPGIIFFIASKLVFVPAVFWHVFEFHLMTFFSLVKSKYDCKQFLL